MKFSKWLLLIMLILPWFTLPLLGKKAVKRFIPSAVFMSLVVGLVNYIAKKRNWWIWFEKLNPKLSGAFPFNWGPFLLGSLWILKWTYGKFFTYLFVNLLFASFFTYIVVEWLKKLGIATLARIKKYQLSLIFFVESLILYGFQMVIDKGFRNVTRFLKRAF